MGHRQRIDVDGMWHHAMNRGAGRFVVFRSRRDGELFEQCIAEQSARSGVEVHAYCLMPNHFHLLVHCPRGGLGDFMRHLTSTFTRQVNVARNTDGSLFRGRYRSIPLETPEYLRAVGRYIHRNPIDVRPVKPLAQYRWSSFRHYVGAEPPPHWLATATLLSHFGDDAALYRDFVEAVAGSTAPRAGILLAILEALVDERPDLRQVVARQLAVAAFDRCTEPTMGELLRLLAIPADRLGRAQDSARSLVAQRPELGTLLDSAIALAA